MSPAPTVRPSLPSVIEVNPSRDVLSTLNDVLPSEHDLSTQAALIQASLRVQLAQTRARIVDLQASLSSGGSEGRVQVIQSLISELLEQTTRIKEKSLESEAVVKSITRDIQALDIGKKNLTSSLSLLRGLEGLNNSVSRLEALLPQKNYRALAGSLSDTKKLATELENFKTLDRVSDVQRKVVRLQAECRGAVMEEFESYFLPEQGKDLTERSVVRDACLLVDVLGVDVRNMLLDRHSTLLLREYRRIFRSSDEAGGLDNVGRRYAFFLRVLKAQQPEEGVWPEDWKVMEWVVARFAEMTVMDLGTVLARKDNVPVSTLLEALQSTLEFESSMSARFHAPFEEIIQVAPPSTAFQRPSARISKVFEGYLGVYVDAQDRAISDILAPSRGKTRPSLEVSRKEGEVEEGEKVRVLNSSTELFYFYGQALEAGARLSRENMLKDLIGVFKKWLKIYAEEVLLASLRREAPRRSTDRRSLEGRANIGEVKNACLVLNTAEYCLTTAGQLEDMCKERIADHLEDEITFQEERDQFIAVISSSLLSLLKELENSIEPHTTSITRTSWDTIENVSGPSTYVPALVDSIDAMGDLVREGVEGKRWLRSWCDKAVGVVMVKMNQALVRSRPLKKVGAEQLLLDFSIIKRCLVELPLFSKDDTRSIQSYQRHVQAATSPFETILKVVLVPEEPPEAFVQNYTMLVGDRSFSNFQKILDLKGTPKKQQASLLDIFVSVTSVLDDLSETSFLSSLDMDAPVSSTTVLANASAADRALLSPTASGIGLSSMGGAGEGLGGRGFSFFKNFGRKESVAP